MVLGDESVAGGQHVLLGSVEEEDEVVLERGGGGGQHLQPCASASPFGSYILCIFLCIFCVYFFVYLLYILITGYLYHKLGRAKLDSFCR